MRVGIKSLAVQLDILALRAGYDFRNLAVRTAGSQKLRKPRKNYFPEIGCLFIHIPKTAGTSIHSYLESLALVVGTHSPTSRQFGLSKHATAIQWRETLGEETWEKTFKFAMVRNPWDLMVSSYLWWRQKAIVYENLIPDAARVRAMRNLDEFIASEFGRTRINDLEGHMEDWYSYQSRDLVDFIGKVENLEFDLAVVCSRLGLSKMPKSTIPHFNTSRRGDYRPYYNDVSAELVAKRFAGVIERFGYAFDEVCHSPMAARPSSPHATVKDRT